MPVIAVLGTMDTKADELGHVAKEIRRLGHEPLLVDVGTFGPPGIVPDISREDVALAAGIDLAVLIARQDRGECVTAMAAAAAALVPRLAREARIHGILALGGGGGTAIGTAAMRALPIGFPKLMVSTLATGNTASYVGGRDIVMFPSIVDLSGLNRISRLLLSRAAGAICGMVAQQPVAESQDRPVIVASMFGNTTACVTAARAILEEAGYEVLVFHATGAGGKTMEGLVESSMASGILDVTTTEWADELVGGILSAGRTRLDAAGEARIPAVIAPGCLDMVNFGEPQSVPARFARRRFYQHNRQVTLMRTTPAECAELGRILAEKINAYRAPTTVLFPTRGLSVIGEPGQPFWDPDADAALLAALQRELRRDVPLVVLDLSINDPSFAKACAEALLANMQADGVKRGAPR
jgi:uncharacterized protein (UPF0261 family)